MGQRHIQPEKDTIQNVTRLCLVLESYGEKQLPVSDYVIRFEPYWRDVACLRQLVKLKMVNMDGTDVTEGKRKEIIKQLEKDSIKLAHLDDIYDCIPSDAASIICHPIRRKTFIENTRLAIKVIEDL